MSNYLIYILLQDINIYTYHLIDEVFSHKFFKNLDMINCEIDANNKE
jgi:hypothetical protein